MPASVEANMDVLSKLPEQERERAEAPSAPAHVWAEPRDLFFFRLGALLGDGTRWRVEILALAESGAIVRTGEAVATDAPFVLELNAYHRLPARVEWSSGRLLGLEFENRAGVRETLAARDRTHPYRAPRLKLGADVVLRLGDTCITARAKDVSEGGIKVELAEPAQVGREAGLIVPGMPPVAGRVQWCRDGRAGISFEPPLPFPRLADCLTRQVEA
jgi:hypothetical protein